VKKKVFGILLVLAVVLSFSLMTAVPAGALPPDNYYVNAATGADSRTAEQAKDAATPWLTIQHAVDTVLTGSTINVAAGTYDEQVVIDISLTLQGVGNTTMIKPSSDATLTTVLSGIYGGGTKQIAGIVVANVAAGSNVTLKNLKVDGGSVTAAPATADYVAGIFYRETGGTVDTVTVANMTVGSTGTAVRGYGLYLSAGTNIVSVEVKSSTITNYDKNGINAHGNRLTANIHDNTITGRGPLPNGDEVQNGVLIMDGATGTVNTNLISDMSYTPETWGSAGILVYEGSGSADGNTITNCQYGVAIQDGNGTAQGNTVNGGTVGLEGLWAQYTKAGTWTASFRENTVTGIKDFILPMDGAAIGAATYNAGASLALTVDGNQLTGGGATEDADGIYIGDIPPYPAGSITATITNNTISGWKHGIHLVSSVDPGSTITMNAITNSTGPGSGIHIEAAVDATHVAVHYNNIVGNLDYGVYNGGSGTLNAENNWWGTASGPGAFVNGDIDASPWLMEEVTVPTVATAGPELVTLVRAVVGLAVSPGLIDFGSILPGESSSVSEGLRTITVGNTGNCDQLISTQIIREERTVTGELLGSGNGAQKEFGPTDYGPIAVGSETVKLNGGTVTQTGNYTMNYAAGTVTFVAPPAGGVMVSIDYLAKSTFYSNNLTLDDPAAPPEVLARLYGRVLVDDETALPVAQVYVPADYPVRVAGGRMEPGQIIFYAEAVSGTDNPPTVDFQAPTDGAEFTAGAEITILTRNIDDWGVVGEQFEVRNASNVLIASGPLTKMSGTALDGIWQAQWNTVGVYATVAGEPYTITVTATDTGTHTGSDSVGVVLVCSDPFPVVGTISTAPVSPVSGMVTITATATDQPLVSLGGGLVSGEYRIDGAGTWTPMTMAPSYPPARNAATFTADWDSTTVLDGDHTINVRVKDTANQLTTGNLAIKVNNYPPVGWTYHVIYDDPQLMTVPNTDPYWQPSFAQGHEEVMMTTYMVGLDMPGTVIFTAAQFGHEVKLAEPAVHIHATFLTTQVIFQGHKQVRVASADTWVSLTGAMLYRYAPVEVKLGVVWVPLNACLEYTWTGPASYLEHSVVLGLSDTTTSWTFAFVGMEDPGVPAGSYMCAKMDYTRVSVQDNLPPNLLTPDGTVRLTQWVNSYTGLIKSIDLTNDGTMTQELVSVYDPGT